MNNLKETHSYFAYRRWQGNAYRLKHLPTRPDTCSTDNKTPTVFLDSHFLQRLEVSLDVRPFELMSGRIQAPIQFLSQNKGQETAENMTTDGLVPFMENGPGVQDRLHVEEDLLHLPEFLVLESNPFAERLISKVFSENPASERIRVSTLPLAWSWSRRPTVEMTRWQTLSLILLFSTRCRY
jgi:hypothetical protein